jgi:hypothetical protein
MNMMSKSFAFASFFAASFAPATNVSVKAVFAALNKAGRTGKFEQAQ